MPERPRLSPRHRPVRRGPDSVQLGAGPNPLVITGLDDGQLGLLELLDGSHTVAELADTAGSGAVEDLLALLRGHALLADPVADRLRRDRPARPVLVGGPPPLADRVCRALTRAGIAARADDWALGELEVALRAGRVSGRDAGAELPGLVVLVGYDLLPPELSHPWARYGVAHLPVVLEAGLVTLGPLVRPPTPADAACLDCLERHRRDHDPARVALLRRAPRNRVPSVTDPGPLLEAAAGLTAMVVAAYLHGDPLPHGVTVELCPPWPRLDHRRWPRHVGCPDHAPPTSLDHGQQRVEHPVGRGTMAR